MYSWEPKRPKKELRREISRRSGKVLLIILIKLWVFLLRTCSYYAYFVSLLFRSLGCGYISYPEAFTSTAIDHTQTLDCSNCQLIVSRIINSSPVHTPSTNSSTPTPTINTATFTTSPYSTQRQLWVALGGFTPCWRWRRRRTTHWMRLGACFLSNGKRRAEKTHRRSIWGRRRSL